MQLFGVPLYSETQWPVVGVAQYLRAVLVLQMFARLTQSKATAAAACAAGIIV
jgi:hypothetical protein